MKQNLPAMENILVPCYSDIDRVTSCGEMQISYNFLKTSDLLECDDKKNKNKVKISHYRPGEALGVLGG